MIILPQVLVDCDGMGSFLTFENNTVITLSNFSVTGCTSSSGNGSAIRLVDNDKVSERGGGEGGGNITTLISISALALLGQMRD